MSEHVDGQSTNNAKTSELIDTSGQDTVVTSEIILENSPEEIEEVKSMFDITYLRLDVKKIAVISDMHANFEAFKAVWEDLQTRDFDAIVCLGDLVGYYTEPEEVIKLTKDISSITVQGNHDLALVSGPSNFLYTTLAREAQEALDYNEKVVSEESKKWLMTLPLKVVLQTPYATITMVHGDPLTIFGYIYGITPELFEASILHALAQVDTDYLLVGHSHIQGEYFDEASGKRFVNPGSIGQPRDRDQRAAYSIIDLEKRENQLIRVEYDITKTIQNVHVCKLPDYLGSRLLAGE